MKINVIFTNDKRRGYEFAQDNMGKNDVFLPSGDFSTLVNLGLLRGFVSKQSADTLFLLSDRFDDTFAKDLALLGHPIYFTLIKSPIQTVRKSVAKEKLIELRKLDKFANRLGFNFPYSNVTFKYYEPYFKEISIEKESAYVFDLSFQIKEKEKPFLGDLLDDILKNNKVVILDYKRPTAATKKILMDLFILPRKDDNLIIETKFPTDYKNEIDLFNQIILKWYPSAVYTRNSRLFDVVKSHNFLSLLY